MEPRDGGLNVLAPLTPAKLFVATFLCEEARVPAVPAQILLCIVRVA